jgi:hypothetical protein
MIRGLAPSEHETPVRRKHFSRESGIRTGLSARTMWHFQAVLLHQFRIGEKLCRWSVGGKLAAIEHEHPRAKIQHQVEVVCGDQLGAGQSANETDEIAPAARVEERTRFIEQQHRRPHRQHTGEGRTPFVATGKLERYTLPTIRGQPDSREGLGSASLRFVGRKPEIQRTEAHIIQHRRAEELIVRILEHNADGFGQLLPLLRIGRIESADDRLARLAVKHAAKSEKERRLARPVRPHESHAFAGFDSERDLFERDAAIRVTVAQVVNDE